MLYADAIQVFLLWKCRILGVVVETYAMSAGDWKEWIPYPYKGLNDPEYLKDKAKMFNKHGNGWWWGDGWWSGHNTTSAEKQRRYRKNNEK